MERHQLILSLKDAINMADGKVQLRNGEYFTEFYGKLKHDLITFSKQEKNKLILIRTEQLPEFSLEEIEEYISKPAYGGAGGSGLFGLIGGLIQLIFIARKEIQNSTKDKMRELSGKASSIVHILEHPGIEELILEAETKEKNAR